MRIKKEKVKILIVVSLLLLSISCLYYYFFIKLDIDLIFWKSTGEKIYWNNIEYDDDFFPIDSTRVYGEYGEWKFKEFRPIYAGHGTTKDGLNFLIGKYLDEDGKEKVVNILVSGEGVVDYPWPDKDMFDIYNMFFRGNVALLIEPGGLEPFDSKELKGFEEFLETLKVGDQLGVTYLSEWKDFESCRLESSGMDRMYCVNGYLNETYGDKYMVATYIDGSL